MRDGKINFHTIIVVIYLSLLFLLPRYVEFSMGEVRVSAHRVISALMFLFLIFHYFNGVRFAKGSRGIVILFLIYFLAISISSVMSSSSGRSYYLLIDDFVISFSLLIISSSLNRANVEFILKWIVRLSVILSLFAIFEYLLKYNIYSSMADRSTTLGYFGSLEYYRNGSYRAKGPFEHPLVLSVLLATCLPIVVSSSGRFKSVSIGIIIIAIVATQSRMGMLLIPVSLFLGFVVPRIMAKLGIGLSLIITLLLVGLFAVLAKTSVYEFAMGQSQSEMSSSQTRLDQIEIGIELLESNWLYGFGYGNASAALIEQREISTVVHNKSVDNYYLSTALDAGLIGLAAIVLLKISGMKYAFLIFSRSRDIFSMKIGLALFSAILCSTIYYGTLSIRTVFPVVFLLIGLSASEFRNYSTREK